MAPKQQSKLKKVVRKRKERKLVERGAALRPLPRPQWNMA